MCIPTRACQQMAVLTALQEVAGTSTQHGSTHDSTARQTQSARPAATSTSSDPAGSRSWGHVTTTSCRTKPAAGRPVSADECAPAEVARLDLAALKLPSNQEVAETMEGSSTSRKLAARMSKRFAAAGAQTPGKRAAGPLVSSGMRACWAD
jgi:hypothetical protein